MTNEEQCYFAILWLFVAFVLKGMVPVIPWLLVVDSLVMVIAFREKGEKHEATKKTDKKSKDFSKRPKGRTWKECESKKLDA